MRPEDWSNAFRIFEAAVEQPAAERPAFLDATCAGDPALRAAVEAMLQADASALALFGMQGPSLVAALDDEVEVQGAQQVGPYRIVCELGRGGMGTVYLAERADVGKQVALKLVRGALAAPETLERFLVERKILARLEHPNVAALLDAGVTNDGTPWFAMEKVDGEAITAAADNRRLGIAARLHAFEQVCDAVAYAHRNAVVHRDLKPSNILVDADGRVKLLDFGIAKLLGDESDATTLTRTGLRPMTPEYAAPEQVRGEPVSPATDVYALGAVLYELLTGHRPQRVRGGSLAEVEHAVLRTEPPLPSTAVGRTDEIRSDRGLERITPEVVAAARATEPRRLRRRLRGDLDAMVMRAMAKDPSRRYPSADELLADVRSHLQGLPITARADTRGYRLRKFAGRHPAGMSLAVAAAVLLALVTVPFLQNLAVSRDPTRAAATTALQFSRYLNRMFAAAEPADAATTVAVYPFTFHGGADWEHLGDGMVRLLSTQFSGAGSGLRAIDPRAIGNRVGRDRQQIRDAQQAANLAARLGAGSFVLGDIVEADGRLRISAALYGTGPNDTRPVTRTSVEGDAAAVFSLVDELSARLLAGFGPSRRMAGLAARTTDSPAALLAFLEGDRELREGRFTRAVEPFRRATHLDTTFALAYYGLSRAASWTGQPNTAGYAAVAAVRHAARLAAQDRWLVEAWDHYRLGNVEAADSLYRAVLRERPDDVEAWLQIGEIGFHYGPMLGRPPPESRAAFERVLDLEPANADAVIHLARLAAQAGEHARLDTLVRRFAMLDPDGEQAMQLAVLQSIVRGDSQLPERLRTQLDDADAQLFRTLVTTAAAHGGDLARVTRLVRERAGPGGTTPDLDHAWMQVMLAQLELARGRWNAAREALDAVARLAPGWDDEFRAALLSMAPFEDRAELAAARAALDRSATATPIAPYASDERRTFLRGMLSLRLDDPAGLQAQVDSLEDARRKAMPNQAAFRRRFALDLRAQLAARQGRAAEALALLGPAGPQPDQQRPAPTSYYKATERWLRAELLVALGRDAEALRWYATFPDPDAYDLVYLAPSHLRRAALHDRRGERTEAIVHYDRFLDLWKDADPMLHDLVESARQRRAALERE